MMKTTKSVRCGATIIAAAASVLVTANWAMAASGAWLSPTAGGNWSDGTKWDSGSAPGAGDTATLGDATANRTIVYNAAASGTLGTLDFTQTDGFINLLDSTRSLTITNAVTLGASGGTAQFFSDPTSSNTTNFTGGLTVNSGGVLEVESYQALAASAVQTTIAGNVTLSGGTLLADQSVGQSKGAGLAINFNNALSMSSGTISIGLNSPTGNALAAESTGAVPTTIDRLTINGPLSLTGGSVLSSTTANNIWVQGNSATIGTLLTDLPVQLGLVVPASASTPQTQTLQSDTAITGGVLIRNLSSNVASVNDSIGTKTGGGPLSFGSGTLTFQNSDTSGSITAALTSDVTAGATPVFQGGAASSQTVTIDTAGHTLDLGTAAQSLSATGANAIAWSYLSSSGNGTFKAASFDLSGAAGGATVGSNLTLEATGTGGTTSTLSNAHGGAIDPTSTFTYAGTGTTTNFAKLVSSRNIGNLAVTAGALQLGSAITTGSSSTTKVSNGATLDLGAFALNTTSVTSDGTIGGNGSITASGGVTSNGTFTPGGDGTVGAITIGSGSGALALNGTSDFDIAGDSSFDTVSLNGQVNYAGVLALDFSYTPTVGQGFNLFTGGAGSGNFSSITSNLSGFDYSFNPTSGRLTLSAVPEPTSLAMLGVGAVMLVRRRRRAAI